MTARHDALQDADVTAAELATDEADRVEEASTLSCAMPGCWDNWTAFAASFLPLLDSPS